MKCTDKLVQKIGADKLLHMAFGGWFVALFTIVNLWAGVAAFAVLAVLSIVKELKLDAQPDWLDAVYAIGAGAVSLIVGIVTTVV